VANTDIEKPKSTELAERKARYRDHVIREITSGKKPTEVARALAKDDPVKARRHRARIRRILWSDEGQKQLMQAAKLEALVGAVRTIPAVTRRAERGRVDAAKFLGEVSGFHNPKVNHEHSGEVKFKFVAVPRPALTPERKAVEEAIVDADVVEED
jgi:hypothetical protein